MAAREEEEPEGVDGVGREVVADPRRATLPGAAGTADPVRRAGAREDVRDDGRATRPAGDPAGSVRHPGVRTDEAGRREGARIAISVTATRIVPAGEGMEVGTVTGSYVPGREEGPRGEGRGPMAGEGPATINVGGRSRSRREGICPAGYGRR